MDSLGKRDDFKATIFTCPPRYLVISLSSAKSKIKTQPTGSATRVIGSWSEGVLQIASRACMFFHLPVQIFQINWFPSYFIQALDWLKSEINFVTYQLMSTLFYFLIYSNSLFYSCFCQVFAISSIYLTTFNSNHSFSEFILLLFGNRKAL